MKKFNITQICYINNLNEVKLELKNIYVSDVIEGSALKSLFTGVYELISFGKQSSIIERGIFIEFVIEKDIYSISVERINNRLKEVIRKNFKEIINNDSETSLFLSNNDKEVSRIKRAFQLLYIQEPKKDLLEFYYKNSKVHDFVVNIMKRIDLGISDIVIRNTVDGYKAWMVHFINEDSYEIPLEDSSRGTILIYEKLYYIYKSMFEYEVIVIPYFDENLHPLLSKFLFNSFIIDSKSQVILSSIDPDNLTPGLINF